MSKKVAIISENKRLLIVISVSFFPWKISSSLFKEILLHFTVCEEGCQPDV